MKPILALLCSCLCAGAADHIISWSFNPADQFVGGYCLYEQIGGIWQRRADVPGSVNTVTLPNVTSGLHIYSVSATNGIGEGPKSLPVNAIVPNLPTAPTNVIVNLRAAIESSKDANGPWQELLALSVPIETSTPTALYRIRQDIYR